MAKIRQPQRQRPKNQKGAAKKRRFLNSNKRKNGPIRNIKKRIPDARQKIARKGKVVDAREILAKKSKITDARSRINRLRESIKPIGSNILKKTDRNGKISLLTKDKGKGTMDIKGAIQKQLGLISPPRRVRSPPRKIPIPYEPIYEPTMFKWLNPTVSIRPSRRETVGDKWENFSISRPIRPTYVDLDLIDDEEMPMAAPRRNVALQGTSRITNVHSRLEAARPEPETHGILAQTKTKVVVPAGHRIVVSNLQSTVSQEDIKELFEDIGDLLAARLVRPGVAEVIYKNLKDAQNAVDSYHNRQLDGQPMKCLLVNKRPLNNPTAPALPKAEISKTKMVQSSKLVPDISTIHKALFQRN